MRKNCINYPYTHIAILADGCCQTSSCTMPNVQQSRVLKMIKERYTQINKLLSHTMKTEKCILAFGSRHCMSFPHFWGLVFSAPISLRCYTNCILHRLTSNMAAVTIADRMT